MASTNPTGIIITSGLLSLSCVSGVVVFDVLFTNVDSVVSDKTVTLLKKYKAEIYQVYLMIKVSDAELFFEHFYKCFLFDQKQYAVSPEECRLLFLKNEIPSHFIQIKKKKMENQSPCIIAILIVYILRKMAGFLFENNAFSFIVGLHFNARYDLNWLICPGGQILLVKNTSILTFEGLTMEQ